MKQVYVTITALLFAATAMAQPWLDGFGNRPVKVDEIIATYEQKNAKGMAGTAEEEFEGKDYHYQRWKWYWEGRTDAQGYIISPYRYWMEWKKIEAAERARSKTTSPDAVWTFHGPTNPLSGNFGLGRINVMEFHPTDTNTFIIGTPGGGMWRTTDDGMTWKLLDDFLPVLGVADIDYNPQNPNTIYACTGDRDAGDTYSMGVFKSTDGGLTWDTTGLQYGLSSYRKTNGLLINPLDTNSLTVATSVGIMKSADAGATWITVQNGFFQQIMYRPGDTSVVYAIGGNTNTNQQVYRSTDGGNTWAVASSFPGNRRAVMATTTDNPNLVMVVVANADYGLLGIYKSTDTGKTYTMAFDPDGCKKNILASDPKGDDCGGQGWYDLTIQISPLDENKIIVGGVNTWYSNDGATTFDQANQWKNTIPGVNLVHADKHYHIFHPLKPGMLYECNDGGIFKSGNAFNGNSIWNDISEGLGITQFYRNAVAGNASFVLGGAQDNGTKMLRNGTSTQMTGADGMDCQIDYADSNVLYTSQQYGELRRSTDGGQKFKDIQANIPGKPKGAWITPIVLSPKNHQALFAGYEQVFFSTDQGDSWNAISPDFNTDIERIALTPLHDDYIYVMLGNAIRYTTDFGNAWTYVANPTGSSISDIMVDPKDKDLLWVTIRSFNANQVRTFNRTAGTWATHIAGLPNIPVNCIAYDTAYKTFYVGTDLGVYYREADKNDWQMFNNGTLPNVEVIDLGINPTSQTIWAATYGRGMWSSPLHKTTTGIANTIPLAADVVTIAPNPNYGSFVLNTGHAALKGQQALVRIYNITGAVAWEKNIALDNGKAEINASLPRGTYIVEVLKEHTIFAKTKMVVY